MKDLFVAGAAASWVVTIVALTLVTKRGGWDHTSAETQVQARRLRPVAAVAGALGSICLVGWAVSL